MAVPNLDHQQDPSGRRHGTTKSGTNRLSPIQIDFSCSTTTGLLRSPRQWTAAKLAYDRECAKRRVLVEIDIYRDPSAMEAFLEARLQEVVWPRETQVALEVKALGELVMLDVDLPKIEEMPTQLAAAPARGLRLSVKELSCTKVQKM